MDITTSPHAELQIACAPPYCRALSAPTNNIRIGRRTAICSVHVRLGQQSPDDGLFTSSDPFPRRAQIGRASSTFLISHSHSHHGDGHNMYAQTTDDVQWSGILRDVERKKSTELSFPPCGDREISVGDLSFLSFLSRSSAPSRLQSPWPSSLEERSTDAHRRRTHSSRDATRPSAACGFVSFGSQHPGLRRNCRPWGNCRPYSSLLLNSSSCLIVRVVPHSPHYSCENSSIAIIIVRISPHKSA